MRILALITTMLSATAAYAGQLGSEVLWISDATPSESLMLNNDDYMGDFEDNPNRFKVNAGSIDGVGVLQSIVDTQRIIPTRQSGGVTEYAISIGGSYSDGHGSPGVTLDSQFMVQLGFGTGSNFVRASEVAPELVFDHPGNVSPEIKNFFFFLGGEIPILKLIGHEGDTLIYQGSSTSGTFSSINFAKEDLFMLPLDIPDLPETVRDFYSSSELAGLAAADIPFTLRIRPVPEPSTVLLGTIGLFLSLPLLRSGHRSRGQ